MNGNRGMMMRRKNIERRETSPGLPASPELDRLHHDAAQEEEVSRMLSNWVRWKLGGASISLAMSLQGLPSRGTRSETPVPLINGEAVDVDSAVEALPGPLRLVVHVHWLHELPDRQGRPRRAPRAPTDQRARACRCSVRTYFRRLRHAHDRIVALMRAKKVEAARRRQQYVTRAIIAK